MKALQTMGAAALLAMMVACGNTADGAKKDAENATDKTAEVAADAGNAMSGAAETGQVKTALLANDQLDASDINVETDEGKKVVTLKGTVPAEAHKKLAGEIATEKAVGYAVVNELTIKPK